MTAADTTSSAAQSTRAAVDAYVKAWNTRDGAAVVDTMTPAGTFVDPIITSPISGPELAGYVAALATAFPDFAFTWDVPVVEGSRALLRWTMTGTYEAPLPGLPGPTGASFVGPGIDIVDVVDGRVASVVGYWDQIAFMRQLGLDVQVSAPEDAN